MNEVLYCVLNDLTQQRVGHADCDAVEQAGVIDRTLIPVQSEGQGWADSRRSGYSVTGRIEGSTATFNLADEGVHVAVLAVCLDAAASEALWRWLGEGATTPLPTQGRAPAAPWAALRWDVDDELLPIWIDWWAKHTGFALANRLGW